MEFCMEARALKSSLLGELAKKPTTQNVFLEEFLCFDEKNGVVSNGEDFSVDCFLDFSNGEFKDDFNDIQGQDTDSQEDEEEKDSLSVSSREDKDSLSISSQEQSFSGSFLAVPDDELADLEWVSHFVDDSSPEFSLLCPAGNKKPEVHAKNRFESEPMPALTKTISCLFPSQVPAKTRTKRARPTGRTWSVGSTSAESVTSSPTSSCNSSSTGSCLTATGPVQISDTLPNVSEPPKKKLKKRPAVQPGGTVGSVQIQRRCTHCQVQKTPQWRSGPLGPKTLCNACGVRYKSGRLFPEYRPACSPTFSGEIHSNSHRKVLEMRKKKETGGPETGLSQMVQSF